MRALVVRRTLKRLAGLAVLAILLLIGAGAALFAVLRSTVPAASGTVAVAELKGPVEVIRDGEGVPHIFGTTLEDLCAALGFAHAQDRMWQMELLRRSGQGRLSEIFGERTLRTDIFLRALDLYGHAERSFAALPEESRALLEAYARGVNAFIGRETGFLGSRLSPEFVVLRHRPELWRPADSIVIVKLMALKLSANLQHEIARLSYAAQGLTSAEIADLMPGETSRSACFGASRSAIVQ